MVDIFNGVVGQEKNCSSQRRLEDYFTVVSAQFNPRNLFLAQRVTLGEHSTSLGTRVGCQNIVVVARPVQPVDNGFHSANDMLCSLSGKGVDYLAHKESLFGVK